MQSYMLISGNQTAVKEIITLLDPDFLAERMCHRCNSNFGQQVNDMEHEEIYGLTYHVYDIEYDGYHISKCKDMNQAHFPIDGSDNLLNGCVK